MADTLLVRLSHDPQQSPSWVPVNADGQLLAQPTSGAPGELAAQAAGRRVVVLVPAEDVLLLAAALPSGNDARLAQILPFALEDQVAEELDSLHFAAGGTLTNGQTAVAVVSRALLERWLAAVAQLGLTPQAVYADAELLPVFAGHLTALLEGESFAVASEGQRPCVLPAEDPGLALELAVGSDVEELSRRQLIVYASSTDWTRHAQAIEALRPRVAGLKVQLLGSGTLSLLAAQLPQARPINLLQGGYAPVRSSPITWNRWRVPAALAAGLLLIHLVSSSLELRRLAGVDKSLDAGLEQAFHVAMPAEPYGRDARRKLELRLAQLQGSAPDRGSLLSMLAALADAHARSPQVQILGLSYQMGQLDLKLSGPDIQSLDGMGQALRASGLKADLAAGSAKGQAYEGRLQVRSNGS